MPSPVQGVRQKDSGLGPAPAPWVSLSSQLELLGQYHRGALGLVPLLHPAPHPALHPALLAGQADLSLLCGGHSSGREGAQGGQRGRQGLGEGQSQGMGAAEPGPG